MSTHNVNRPQRLCYDTMNFVATTISEKLNHKVYSEGDTLADVAYKQAKLDLVNYIREDLMNGRT